MRKSLVALMAAVLMLLGAAAYLLLRPPPFVWLADLPAVAEVDRAVTPRWPAGTIVHLADRRVTPSEAEDEARLVEAEAVQAEQAEVLRALLARGVRAVGIEVSEGDMRSWEGHIAVLRSLVGEEEHARHLAKEARGLPRGESLSRKAEDARRRCRRSMALAGAAARLIVEGEDVRPFALHDHDLLMRAAWWEALGKPEGKAPHEDQARLEAMVGRAVAAGGPAVAVVLGAEHDLEGAVRRRAPRWACVRVTTRAAARPPH